MRNKISFIFRYLLAALVTSRSSDWRNPTARAADQGAILVYPASYFAGIELNTAHDMITRVPGFVFIDTDTTKRGFGAASGNVLIDGVRPSSKTDTLSSVLDRIARSRVDRIEVIRGSAPGIDMQGQTVVANVILKRADESHVIATLTNTIYGDGHQGPGASVEFTSRAGENTYDVMLSRINTIDDDSAGNGTRFLTLAGQPMVIDASHHRGAEKAGYGLNASLSRPIWQGAFTANLTLQQTTYNSAVFYDPPDAASFPYNHRDTQRRTGRQLGPLFRTGGTDPGGIAEAAAERIFQRLHFQRRPSDFHVGQRHQRIHPARHGALYPVPDPDARRRFRRRLQRAATAIPASFPTTRPSPCRRPIPRSMRNAAKPISRPVGVLRPTGRWKRARDSNSPPFRPRAFRRAIFPFSSRASC